MTNLFFKSASRLIKNESLTYGALERHLQFVLTEQRHQRQDLIDIKRMINRLLIDKHLQQQVDTYFEDDPDSPNSDETV